MTIKEEHIRQACDRIQKAAESQKPPTARYIKYTKLKKISVTYDFDLGSIAEVEIIAPRELWLEIHYDVNKQTFESIEPYLSGSRQKLEGLREYAKDAPGSFCDDLFICADCANTVNPLYKPSKRARKPSRYELSWQEKNEVSNIAIRLHVYLYDDIGKRPEAQWPAYIQEFLEEYEIAKENLGWSIALQEDIRHVLTEYWGGDFGERFWQTFVVESPISLSRVHKLKQKHPERITPERDPFLKELFQEFMS